MSLTSLERARSGSSSWRLQATAIVGKGCQVTITSVGRSDDKQIHLAANGSVVGWQRRIQGHVFGMCNPLSDIPKLLRLYRAASSSWTSSSPGNTSWTRSTRATRTWPPERSSAA